MQFGESELDRKISESLFKFAPRPEGYKLDVDASIFKNKTDSERPNQGDRLTI